MSSIIHVNILTPPQLRSSYNIIALSVRMSNLFSFDHQLVDIDINLFSIIIIDIDSHHIASSHIVYRETFIEDKHLAILIVHNIGSHNEIRFGQ